MPSFPLASNSVCFTSTIGFSITLTPKKLNCACCSSLNGFLFPLGSTVVPVLNRRTKGSKKPMAIAAGLWPADVQFSVRLISKNQSHAHHRKPACMQLCCSVHEYLGYQA